MLVIENCNSLSELRQKLIDGEEVRTARDKPCEDAIRREDAINAVSEALEHVFVEHEDIAKKMINKLPSVKPQESCKDAINRAKALEAIRKLPHAGWLVSTESVLNVLSELPPVTPQPKTGHWKAKSFHELFCDNCGFDFDIMRNDFIDKMNYCPNCGAKMVEPQESEE